jgi:hypothetical protein
VSDKLTVVAAAILENDGTVYSVTPPGRHHDVMKLMKEQGCSLPISGVQGFLLSDGMFADRTYSAEVAIRSGQIDVCKFQPKQLFSEDLW